MTEMVGSWLHFTARQPKRNRAELVCLLCHSKKIKCDLQSRNKDGHVKCSNCDTQERDCVLRPSKRGKPRRRVAGMRQAQDESRNSSRVSAIGSPSVQSSALAPNVSGPSGAPGAPHVAFIEVATAQGEHRAGPVSPLQSRLLPSHGFLNDVATSEALRPGQPMSGTSPTEGVGRSHYGDVDTGFLQIYGPENKLDAEQQDIVATLEAGFQISDPKNQRLQQSFLETYFEFCYPWCPVLDSDTISEDMKRSPMLANAVALAASHIQPPLIPYEGPAVYYEKARRMFYDDEEPDALTALRSIALFYWWAPRPPSTVHRHSSWWWTSVIIRHAQQMNIHREPSGGHPLRHQINISLRRRVWWTAFARERLTSLCQSKPCIIDPEDTNIQEPQPSDFPDDPVFQRKGRIFIYWVRLCAIIGKISKALSRSSSTSSHPFPVDLRQELVDWVQSLPPDLQLPIGSSRTGSFDRDVHQLHLPYLTTVLILHLKRSAHDLPQAFPPAIMAASCVARILSDILSRGNARFLMAITCWYCGTAFIPLVQARRVHQLAAEAEEGMDVLTHAVDQLQQMWASANVIRQGFDRLRQTRPAVPQTHRQGTTAANLASSASATGHEAGTPDQLMGLPPRGSVEPDHFDWTLLFPFVTRGTSRIAECLINDKEFGTRTTALPSPDNALLHDTVMHQYQDLLEAFTDCPLDIFDTTFDSVDTFNGPV